MIRRKDGELKEGESIGGFFIKLVIALVAVIIVATIVPDVLGVNVAELCIEDGTILGGITGNHCGDASVFLTDAVKTIIGDGYSFLLVFIALAFIGIGAYKGVTYRILEMPIEFGIKQDSHYTGTK
ncbi:hypothetical protein [Nitrosopumilus sp.]|uniref:hypothetical protein n=1 Tax=Nitrosopumilus sp. TaxID=2024843 RepID=UPI002930D75A|nr:hypothetical protein [Nitrosopumilus sp.]